MLLDIGITKLVKFSGAFKRDIETSRYRAEIDGLRFLANAIVMIGHLAERVQKFWLDRMPEYNSSAFNGMIDFLARPGNGVALFFLISGFVIGKQMQDKSHQDFSYAYFWSYYIRRAQRIFPPYYAVLLLTFAVLVASGMTPPGTDRVGDTSQLAPSLFASLFYVHGIIFDSLPNLFPPGWSLEVEVQFYLLAPLLFLILSYFQGSSRKSYLVLLTLGFLTSAFVLSLKVPHLRHSISANSIYFLVGIFFARFERDISSPLSKIGHTMGGTLAVVCVISLVYLGGEQNQNYEWIRVFLVATISAFLFGMALNQDSLWGKFCRIRIISTLGMMCYSLYLVHMQVFHLLAAVSSGVLPFGYFYLLIFSIMALFISLFFGIGFFLFIERPFAQKTWPVDALNWVKSFLFARKERR